MVIWSDTAICWFPWVPLSKGSLTARFLKADSQRWSCSLLFPEQHSVQDTAQLPRQTLGSVKTCLQFALLQWATPPTLQEATQLLLLFLTQSLLHTTAKGHMYVALSHCLARSFQWLPWPLKWHASSSPWLAGPTVALLFGDCALSWAHYPPATCASFCSSNTLTPFLTLGLYKLVLPSAWKGFCWMASLSSLSSFSCNVKLGERPFPSSPPH